LNPSEEAVGTSAVESDAQAEDRKLAAAILRKNRKATAEFVAKYADPIYRYVRSRLIPRMDLVDDLVQAVFLAAWESLPSYRCDLPWCPGSRASRVTRRKITIACLRASLPLEEAEQETPKVVMEVDIDELLDRGVCSKGLGA
jgi:DNA-directed RNA polymerase specialized sigma24 family protein